MVDKFEELVTTTKEVIWEVWYSDHGIWRKHCPFANREQARKEKRFFHEKYGIDEVKILKVTTITKQEYIR